MECCQRAGNREAWLKMKGLIKGCVSALTFATREDIYRLLENDGRLNKHLVDEKLAELVRDDVLLQVLPEENELGIEGFTPGPNLDVDVDMGIHRRIVAAGMEKKSFSILNIGKITDRVTKGLQRELETLLGNIAQLHVGPRSLELDYFTLRVKYYSWRRFFYENFDHVFFEDFKDRLNECRRLLNRLDID